MYSPVPNKGRGHAQIFLGKKKIVVFIFFYPRKFGHDPSPYWALDYTRWGFKAQLSELARCIVNPKHSKTLTFCHLCVYNNVQPQLFNCLRRGHSLSGALAKAPWLLKPISKKKLKKKFKKKKIKKKLKKNQKNEIGRFSISGRLEVWFLS